ncbi:hypothetical protein [uncultured Acetobacteroides sp.]|uniref:hypothetical protein n=1 Tax=uncultured Acetobacteroides sp. TaxID=1760811 RepID=UPI0029F4CEAB|nr:hypothetical protein [uncultured Acetobacteroides sp.]
MKNQQERTFNMPKKILLSFLLCVAYLWSYSQNERPYREEYVLKLPVNSKQFYEQKVNRSPFFVKDNILQIYPGEKIFVEVESDTSTITSMKVVKENLNPEKTITIELSQEVKDRISEHMMLEINNPFNKVLEYKAMMFIVGHDKWISTDVLPVKAKLTSFEMWNDVITTLVLSDWKLK